jgi:hypothetical protein
VTHGPLAWSGVGKGDDTVCPPGTTTVSTSLKTVDPESHDDVVGAITRMRTCRVEVPAFAYVRLVMSKTLDEENGPASETWRFVSVRCTTAEIGVVGAAGCDATSSLPPTTRAFEAAFTGSAMETLDVTACTPTGTRTAAMASPMTRTIAFLAPGDAVGLDMTVSPCPPERAAERSAAAFLYRPGGHEDLSSCRR